MKGFLRIGFKLGCPNDPIEGTIPTLGAIPAPNLTSGNGGIGQSYTEADWVRTIHHGIKPNNQAVIYMYVSTISDQDLGDLIAYLKQIAPVDTDSAAISYGPILPILPALGIFMPAAEMIDHNALRPEDPVPGATVEYGKYLSAICAQCHGNGISNAVKNWKQEDFIRTFNTGVLPDGRQLGPTMSSKTFNELNDTELVALWLYFTNIDILWGVPSVVYGVFCLTIMIAIGMAGGSLLFGIIAVTLLEIPIITRCIDESIKMVPIGLKESAYSLGSDKI